MARPEVTQAMFRSLPEPGDAGWVMFVSLAGEGFVARAMPLVAEIGDQRVEGLAVTGGGAVGFLRTVPPVGARLRVGYVDEGLQDTGITFPELPNA